MSMEKKNVNTTVEALRRAYPNARTDSDGWVVNEPETMSPDTLKREREEYYACLDRAWDEVGVTEDDALFGEEKLKNALNAERAETAGEICARAVAELSAYAQNAAQSDDITMLTLEYKV